MQKSFSFFVWIISFDRVRIYYRYIYSGVNCILELMLQG